MAKKSVIRTMSVMYYDRDTNGCKRLIKNSREINDSARGKLELKLTNVDRAKKFLNESCAEKLLLEEPFPFDAVIINGISSDSDNVLDDSLFAIEYHSLPFSRIIYLHQGNSPKNLAKKGINCIGISGNGYLTQQNVEKVIKILKNPIQTANHTSDYS